MQRNKLLSVGVLVVLLIAGVTGVNAQTSGGDIVVFDIIDANHDAEARPAGGGGGDILVFDIVDSGDGT